MPKSRAREVDVPRLCQAVYKARLTLKRYREEMTSMVQQLVGRHWSDEGARETVPLNLISSYVSIVGRKLVDQNPRVLLSTWNKGDKAAVNAMQGWANKELENMNFAKTLERVVRSALFSVGFTKVCLATPADAAHRNWNLKPGSPFAEEVLLDDMVWDVHARSFEEVGYIGHRYRVPLDVVKDSKLYTRARLKLEAQPDPQFNREGDLKLGVLGRSFYSDREEFEDFVDLWELYLPRHRLVLTLADDFMNGPLGGEDGEPLRAVDWVGPDAGPIEVLGFGEVPGNAMPTAPLQNLRDLHDPVNNVLRKLIRQAQRQKEVLPIRDGGTEDGERLVSTSDGEAFRSDGEPPKPVAFGGPNVQNFELMMKLQELFKEQAGNLDAVGGLNPQSKTLGQDEMLQASASSLIQAMQERTVGHARAVVKRLCWYWWNHPTNVMESSYSPAGLKDHALVRRVYPRGHADPRALKRSGRLCDLDVQVDPYSMQGQTPQSQLAALNQVFTQVIVPLAPVLQAQGIVPDMNYYLSLLARLMNLPDLPQVVSIVEPPAAAPDSGGEEPRMPATSNRTYTRVSQGSQTAGNRNAAASMRMSGAMGANGRNGTVNREG